MRSIKITKIFASLVFLLILLSAENLVSPALAQGTCKANAVTKTITEDLCDHPKYIPKYDLLKPPNFCKCVMDPSYHPAEVETGLGPIPTDPGKLVEWFFSLTTKVAGGVALLLLVFGGIKIITTQGDPKAFDAAKGTITRALSGLLLVVLAVFILKLIGYDILQLPGWKDSGGDLELPQ